MSRTNEDEFFFASLFLCGQHVEERAPFRDRAPPHRPRAPGDAALGHHEGGCPTHLHAVRG